MCGPHFRCCNSLRLSGRGAGPKSSTNASILKFPMRDPLLDQLCIGGTLIGQELRSNRGSAHCQVQNRQASRASGRQEDCRARGSYSRVCRQRELKDRTGNIA